MTIYDTNMQANPSVQYGEGLIKPEPSAHMELDNMINTGTFGKIKSFDRVTIYINIFIIRDPSTISDLTQHNT
jgi:hypothetical protein